jgi:putative transposase
VSRPPRIAGFSYIGPYRYFLTYCARSRRPAFCDQLTVDETLAQFRRTAVDQGFVILAYCLMPDHIHMLVEGTRADSHLKRFVKLSKQRSGAAYALRNGQPLWQEGYYEHVLREEDDSKTIARYILNNPVRAGLVVHPMDYPHIGSDRWTLTELIESMT